MFDVKIPGDINQTCFLHDGTCPAYAIRNADVLFHNLVVYHQHNFQSVALSYLVAKNCSVAANWQEWNVTE